MGSVYSLFPSGYVEPTKTTTVSELINMALEEQVSFASKSVIMRVDDNEFAKQLLEMTPPEPITAQYLATLAALIKGGGEHADALREKYTAAAGKAPPDAQPQKESEADNTHLSKQPQSDQKDSEADNMQQKDSEADNMQQKDSTVVEKYVLVHYCPSCGKIYRGSEEDESESSDDSTLSNSLD